MTKVIRSIEDIKESKSITSSGVCVSGREVEIGNIHGKDIILIPLGRVPEDVPVLPAPSFTAASTGSNQRRYIALQFVDSSGRLGAYSIKSVTMDSNSPPINVSWSWVSGATSVRIYVSRDSIGWYLVTTVSPPQTSYQITNILDIPSGDLSLSYDIAEQTISARFTPTESGFIPYIELFKTDTKTYTIGVSRTIGDQPYIFKTNDGSQDVETNFLLIRLRYTWKLNWPGFPGECRWRIKFKLAWSTDENNFPPENTKEFVYSEYWNYSPWAGGSKSYNISNVLYVTNLPKAVYYIKLYDLQQYVSNSYYYFSPSLRVYLDSIDLPQLEKIKDLYGWYLVFE